MKVAERDRRRLLGDDRPVAAAAAVVEWVLGVACRRAGGGLPGFQLFERGTPVGSLHVAKSRSSWWLGSVGPVCTAPGLARSWVLQMLPGARPEGRDRHVLRCLWMLERAGVWHFSRADASHEVWASTVNDTQAELEASGVAAGVGVLSRRRPPVVALTGAGSGLTSAHVVNELVEDEVWRESARTVLRRTDADNRHVFVWVDPLDFLTMAAMERDIPPAPPICSPEVTTIWVARAAVTTGPMLADRLWQTDAVGDWEVVGPVTPPAGCRT